MDASSFRNIDRGHALFSRHRVHRISYEAVVSFPPGTGGNFLTMRDGTTDAATPSMNMFVGRHSHLLFMDDSPWTQPLDLDTLDRALCLDPGLPPPGHSIGRCHNLPWLTTNVFTVSVNELVVITMRPEDAWYCNALNRIKWVCSSDWNSNPHMMFQLLADARHDGEVRIGEYRLLCDAVRQRYGMDCANTVVSWRHFMDCKLRGLPLDDTDAFAETVASQVFSTLTEGLREGTDYYSNLWRGEVFDAQLHEMRAVAGNINMVDYRDLMVAGHDTSSVYLSRIPRHDIAGYTSANLDLVDRWLLCCEPEIAQHGRRRLDVLRAMHSQAGW